MRPVLGIKGDNWVVEIVCDAWYVLLRDDNSDKRKILRFDAAENWEEVENAVAQ